MLMPKYNSTNVVFKVMNAFIHCALEKVRGQLEKKFYVDSFQMTAIWQGSYRGLNKVIIVKIC